MQKGPAGGTSVSITDIDVPQPSQSKVIGAAAPYGQEEEGAGGSAPPPVMFEAAKLTIDVPGGSPHRSPRSPHEASTDSEDRSLCDGDLDEGSMEQSKWFSRKSHGHITPFRLVFDVHPDDTGAVNDDSMPKSGDLIVELKEGEDNDGYGDHAGVSYFGHKVYARRFRRQPVVQHLELLLAYFYLSDPDTGYLPEPLWWDDPVTYCLLVQPPDQLPLEYIIHRGASLGPAHQGLLLDQKIAMMGPAGAVQGKIAVVLRGSYEFEVQVAAAGHAGATGVIVVDNVGGDPPPLPDMRGIDWAAGVPSFIITQKDGTELQGLMKRFGSSLSVSSKHITDASVSGSVAPSLSGSVKPSPAAQPRDTTVRFRGIPAAPAPIETPNPGGSATSGSFPPPPSGSGLPAQRRLSGSQLHAGPGSGMPVSRLAGSGFAAGSRRRRIVSSLAESKISAKFRDHSAAGERQKKSLIKKTQKGKCNKFEAGMYRRPNAKDKKWRVAQQWDEQRRRCSERCGGLVKTGDMVHYRGDAVMVADYANGVAVVVKKYKTQEGQFALLATTDIVPMDGLQAMACKIPVWWTVVAACVFQYIDFITDCFMVNKLRILGEYGWMIAVLAIIAEAHIWGIYFEYANRNISLNLGCTGEVVREVLKLNGIVDIWSSFRDHACCRSHDKIASINILVQDLTKRHNGEVRYFTEFVFEAVPQFCVQTYLLITDSRFHQDTILFPYENWICLVTTGITLLYHSAILPLLDINSFNERFLLWRHPVLHVVHWVLELAARTLTSSVFIMAIPLKYAMCVFIGCILMRLTPLYIMWFCSPNIIKDCKWFLAHFRYVVAACAGVLMPSYLTGFLQFKRGRIYNNRPLHLPIMRSKWAAICNTALVVVEYSVMLPIAGWVVMDEAHGQRDYLGNEAWPIIVTTAVIAFLHAGLLVCHSCSRYKHRSATGDGGTVKFDRTFERMQIRMTPQGWIPGRDRMAGRVVKKGADTIDILWTDSSLETMKENLRKHGVEVQSPQFKKRMVNPQTISREWFDGPGIPITSGLCRPVYSFDLADYVHVDPDEVERTLEQFEKAVQDHPGVKGWDYPESSRKVVAALRELGADGRPRWKSTPAYVQDMHRREGWALLDFQVEVPPPDGEEGGEKRTLKCTGQYWPIKALTGAC